MLRPSFLKLVVMLVLLLVCPVGVQAAGSGQGQAGEHLVASLDGRSLPLDNVPRYHCHDIEFPIVRCFKTQRERIASVQSLHAREIEAGFGTAEPMQTLELLQLSVTYVLWYDHTNYGGASFSSTGAITDLASISWNNRISSFKSTNGGRPKWWDGSAYSGSPWQWPTSAWVPNVGSGNDRFSSVQNVP